MSWYVLIAIHFCFAFDDSFSFFGLPWLRINGSRSRSMPSATPTTRCPYNRPIPSPTLVSFCVWNMAKLYVVKPQQPQTQRGSRSSRRARGRSEKKQTMVMSSFSFAYDVNGLDVHWCGLSRSINTLKRQQVTMRAWGRLCQRGVDILFFEKHKTKTIEESYII